MTGPNKPAAAPGVPGVSAAASSIRIEPMQPEDWPMVRSIYEQGIASGNATLQGAAPAWRAWDEAHRRDCRLVARDGERLLGWVALSPISSRDAYEGVVWLGIYVDTDARGRGVGRALLDGVVRASEAAGIWTLQSGVLAENAASLALHARAGFRRIGVLERRGRDAAGRWRDVVLLERRSVVVGLDEP